MGGYQETVSGLGLGAHPSANQGVRIVPGHSRPSIGAESPIRGDADCCCPPYRDGRAACYALGDGVLRRAVCAQTLAH
jgi:hypothetical protein